MQTPREEPGTRAASGYGAGEKPEWDFYSKCTHCGLCLNACPTYRELSVEMDSPRGRIYQMIQVERGRLPLGESFVRHMDLCLDCRACETACPSGVEYGRLIEAARGQIATQYRRPLLVRALGGVFFHHILPHRARLVFAGKLLRIYQRWGFERLAAPMAGIISSRLGNVARLAPRMDNRFFTERLGVTMPAEGPRRFRVGLFAGCIASLAFSRANEATARVLSKNGCQVVIPSAQGCCGALHVHAGLRDEARQLARRTIEAFPPGDFDAVISNAAGCGSVLKEYPHLFECEGSELLERARLFSGRVRDVTEFLADIGWNRDFGAMRVRATYQDPCHLGHAQKIRSAPRRLLRSVPELEFVELKDNEVCCGSAGIYNITENAMAERLLKAKMLRVEETGAEIVLSANPGCLLQLRAGMAQSSNPSRRVMHVVELLDEAYRKASG